MNILIIGGTRNLGYFLTQELLASGHRVTVFNRGLTPDSLPDEVERLHGDRTEPNALAMAVRSRAFDAVVDTTLYKGPEAEAVVQLLDGRVGNYIFLSTGQVYLVRENANRPSRESDYAGPLMPSPEPNTYDYEEWLYGIEKRQAEDVLFAAWEARRFPFTTLRLPMVNGERDHFHRLYNYILRLKDGGPILVPDAPNHVLRHVYSQDVVRALMILIGRGGGQGKAYNISQDETLSLFDFLTIVGEILNVQPKLVTLSRSLLTANGFLPDCSPFSELWMSEIDNSLSKTELGMTYTPLREYLTSIAAHYDQHPPLVPSSYRRRNAERQLADSEQAK